MVFIIPATPDTLTLLAQVEPAVLAAISRGLSGGDILNVCVNSIYAGSTDPNPERWLVTQEMVEREVAKVRKANAEHSREKGKSRRKIGFIQD